MIYIVCSEKFATGGTELLHQLFFKIRAKTEDVAIFYYNYSNTGSPVHDRFEKYRVDYVTSIEDSSKHLLIVPETCTGILKDYKKIKKFVWWLSVDNYYESLRIKSSNFLKTKLAVAYYFFTGRLKKNRIDFFNDEIYHLVQSHYALDFLRKKGVKNIDYLSDYIGSDFFANNIEYSSINRKNRVLYNPKKGMDFTNKIKAASENIEFIPLINLSPAEVVELCRTSKIYIDFGNHPGKDRFPREASLMGCIIITGLRGSASFYEDVKIPNQYKFNDDVSNISNIVNKIQEVFELYDDLIIDFNEYRDMIKNEEKVFENDLTYLWNKYFCLFVSK